MNEQQERTLSAGLTALAATTRSVSASRHVEAAVLAEMSRVNPHTGREASTQRAAGAWLAIAAALLLASAVGVWLAQRTGIGMQNDMLAAGFVAIPAAAYLPQMESGAIVRVELPLAALPSYGIQITPDMQTDSVDADLLIAQDGFARGIRIIHSHTDRSTP